MNIFEELVAVLKENNLKITFAESCTGGLLSACIVSVADASAVFDGGFVTYSEQMKCELLDVKEDSIQKYGVVSEKVAVEMAIGAAQKIGADIAVGVTGFAGPKKNENDSTVGTVCFGFYIKGKTVSSTKLFGDAGRNVVRELAVNYVAVTLLKLISVFGEK